MTGELFRADAYAVSCSAEVTAVDERGIQLDRSVFYPEGGGQPGDLGCLQTADGREIQIRDTRQGPEPGAILHLPAEPVGWLKPGMQVTATIDWPRRHRLMRMHTCLHLLSAVVVAPVTGGAVGDGYGRLDFDLPESPDPAVVTEALNGLIRSDAPVSCRWISDAELDAQPALVKTLSVQPPRGRGRVRLVEIAGIDLQPCGGTHVARIGEIGVATVVKIEKKGRQNRRLRVEFSSAAARAR